MFRTYLNLKAPGAEAGVMTKAIYLLDMFVYFVTSGVKYNKIIFYASWTDNMCALFNYSLICPQREAEPTQQNIALMHYKNVLWRGRNNLDNCEHKIEIRFLQ